MGLREGLLRGDFLLLNCPDSGIDVKGLVEEMESRSLCSYFFLRLVMMAKRLCCHQDTNMSALVLRQLKPQVDFFLSLVGDDCKPVSHRYNRPVGQPTSYVTALLPVLF